MLSEVYPYIGCIDPTTEAARKFLHTRDDDPCIREHYLVLSRLNLKLLRLSHFCSNPSPCSLRQFAASFFSTEQCTQGIGDPFNRSAGVVVIDMIIFAIEEGPRLRLNEIKKLLLFRISVSRRRCHGAPVEKVDLEFAAFFYKCVVNIVQEFAHAMILRKCTMVLGQSQPGFTIKIRGSVNGSREFPEAVPRNPQSNESFQPGLPQIGEA